MASKMKSEFSSSYKMKSGLIDKRSLRLHRRSQEWKNQRQEETNKRRNLVDLSPLQEMDCNVPSASNKNEDDTPKKPSSTVKGAKPSKKVDERRERLMKWKQEKELKRKLEAQERNKKNPIFKVSSSTLHSDIRVFKKDMKLPALKPVATSKTKPQNGSNASQGDLSSNTNASSSSFSGQASAISKSKGSTVAPAAPGAKKGKGASAAPPATSPARTKASAKGSTMAFQRLNRPTASSKSAVAASAKGPAPVKPRLRGPKSIGQDLHGVSPSKNRHKQMSKKGKSPKAKTKTPSHRVTQQAARVTSEATDDGNSSNNTSMHLPDIERKDNHFNNLNLNKVSTSRGESFAGPDFLFSAPSNIPSFAFKPLSPTSASKFLDFKAGESEALLFDIPQGGRCSTPMALKNQNSGTLSGNEASGSPAKSMAPPGISGAPGTPRSTKRSTHSRSSSGRMIMEEQPATNIPGCVEDTVENKRDVPEEKKHNQLGPIGPGSCHPQFLAKKCSLQEFPDGFSTSLMRRSLRRSLRLASLAESEVQLQGSTAQAASMMEVDSLVSAAEAGSPGRKGDALTPLPASRSKTPAHVTFQSPAAEAREVPMECDDGDAAVTKEPASAKSTNKLTPQSEAGVGTPSPQETPARGRKSMPTADAFVTPGLPLSSRKSNKKRRKTDLVPGQKILSPEEWVDILAKSPMVEMTRRTPRRKSALDTPKIQPLCFDDIEVELERSRLEVEANTSRRREAEEEAQTDLLGRLPEAREKEPAAVAPSPSSQHDVPFFRALLLSETRRLTSLCSHWQEINTTTSDLSENVRGMIRTTVGQAQLLMAQRFKQFSGLVDDCEFHQGERETTTTDLQGFWDMVFHQVEDVDTKFRELEQLQKDGWMVKTPKAETGTARRAKKKKTGRANTKPVGKSKFAAFREQMRKKKEEEEADSSTANSVVVSIPSCAEGKKTTSTPAPEEKGAATKSMEAGEEAQAPVQQQSGGSGSPGSQSLYPFITLTPSFAFMEQTPRQKSYVPAVPSPLLVDSTPKEILMKDRPRSAMPRRRSARLSWVTESAINEVEGVAGPESLSAGTLPTLGGAIPQAYMGPPSTSAGLLPPVLESSGTMLAYSTISTPRSSGKSSSRRSASGQRRSLRQRKSVGFLSELEEKPEEESGEGGMAAAPAVQGSPLDLERYLMPSQSAPHQESPLPSSASPQRKKGKGRKSGLKSADKHRSNQSVHFESSLVESPIQGSRLPATPFNYNSLRPRPRVSVEQALLSPGTEESAAWESDDLLIDLPPMDNTLLRSNQTASRRSLRQRPSLLCTPDKKESYDTGGQDLISFTP